MPPRPDRAATAIGLGACLLAASVAAHSAGSPRRPPDLEGIWTGGTLTPFERPPQLADKPHLSEAEIAALQPEATDKFWAAGHKAGDVGRDNDAFLDDDLALLPTGQTSLVISPPNGLVPLRAEAERSRDVNVKTFDSYETMSQWDRCITRAPTAMFPVVYNNAYQIVQTPTHIMIVSEMIHDVRVIPLDGRPRPDARVTSWAGEARGRWEGDTLVVETTHFNGKGWIATGSNAGRIRGIPVSASLRTTERFTRTDPKTLRYELTIEDPTNYTAAWTIAFPLVRDDEYRMYEYACHEGNSAVQSILGGARAEEALTQAPLTRERG
jgi:hypothetical protein